MDERFRALDIKMNGRESACARIGVTATTKKTITTTLAKVTCDGPKPSSLTASRMVNDQWSLVSPVTFDGWPAVTGDTHL
uniref:Uncharacterized protein n=1 Tax=Oryza sativa subsp. japonica TaxID=39947 RepID=Q84SI1_ORYSJ|nr:unknown protein [Oryza sativa Japonica Group]